MNKQKPGVMLYFDCIEPVEDLSLEEKGMMLEAIIQYAKYGADPNFKQKGDLGMAWKYIKLAIDRDDGRYTNRRLRQKYGGYKGKAREADPTARFPSFDEWKESDEAKAEAKMMMQNE